MKEYNIDLVIDKTFNVRAESLQEAKELAIEKARSLMDTYNSLTIDFVDEVIEEDPEFADEFEAYCYDDKGRCVHCYAIEADHFDGARSAARDFYKSDFPNRPLLRIAIVKNNEEYNYYEDLD